MTSPRRFTCLCDAVVHSRRNLTKVNLPWPVWACVADLLIRQCNERSRIRVSTQDTDGLGLLPTKGLKWTTTCKNKFCPWFSKKMKKIWGLNSFHDFELKPYRFWLPSPHIVHYHHTYFLHLETSNRCFCELKKTKTQLVPIVQCRRPRRSSLGWCGKGGGGVSEVGSVSHEHLFFQCST